MYSFQVNNIHEILMVSLELHTIQTHRIHILGRGKGFYSGGDVGRHH